MKKSCTLELLCWLFACVFIFVAQSNSCDFDQDKYLGDVKRKDDNEFRIAWLAPAREYHNFSASTSVASLKAFLSIIEEFPFVNGYKIRVKWYDSDCHSKSALAAAVDARKYFDPDVFFGPPCSAGLKGVAQLASHWNLPVFGWASNEQVFQNASVYSTLIRLTASVSSFSVTLNVISGYFNWKKYALVSDTGAPYQAIANAIRVTSTQGRYEIITNHDVSPLASDDEIEAHFQQISKFARIIIFTVPWKDFRRYLLIAHGLGFANGEYAFICVHGDLYLPEDLNDYVLSDWGWNRNDTDDENAREIFEYAIHVAMDTVQKEDYQKFIKITEKSKFDENEYWQLPESSGTNDAYAPYLFDTGIVWASLVNLTLKNGGNPRNGAHLWDLVETSADIKTQKGVTGYISFDLPSRDRLLNFIVLDMNETGGFYKLIGFTYTPTAMVPIFDRPEIFKKTKGLWPSGHYPSAVPKCGFYGEKCRELTEKEDGTGYLGTIIGAVILATVVLSLAIAVHLMMRRYRRLQLLQSMLWQVKFEEIDFVTAWITGSVRASFRNLTKWGFSGKARHKGSYKDGFHRRTLKELNENKHDTSPELVTRSLDPGSMFGSVAFARGTLASVKRISQKVNVSLTKEVLQELNQLMEMKHQNTCAFVGACIEPSRAILLWEYCPKGSLQDVIWNQNIKLDQMFMFALCHDVAKGLEFLHKSPLHYHGNLKSTNCVVDSRWTCKLTDFGLTKLRETQHAILMAENDYEVNYEKLLWTAPEVLRQNRDIDKHKADIYSLGIILKEVFTRSGPYTEYPFLMAHEIVTKVRDRLRGVTVFRPNLNLQLKQNAELANLIEDCWAEDPIARPTGPRVLKALNRLNPSKNMTMIDSMIAMLEKYANHLEELVAERTCELDAEKKKTENLLYRMLPQTVAEDLKLGKQVKAEHFDEVTIYFSDVVGFTTICASSTPIEVVNFLNSLYTLFDAIITKYDVYKVETIGDAYMLASGLPKRNGKAHIKEVADCSLDILASVSTFCIPHQPDKRVKIRIGLHTGPVVAGVVGRAMPRYCLFGDTVNTASRMESTGQPLRIQMSEKSKIELDRYHGYKILYRGDIPVKGKGSMKTYFLCGREGLDIELPHVEDIPCYRKNSPTTVHDDGKKHPRPSVTSCTSTASSFIGPGMQPSISKSEIWDERYESKPKMILEITQSTAL